MALLVAIVALPPGGRVSTSVSTLGMKGGDKAVITWYRGLQATRGMNGNVHQNEQSLFVGDVQGFGVSGWFSSADMILDLTIVQGGDELFDEVYLIAHTRVRISQVV